MKTKQRAAGFTLMELMVVIFILSIVLAVVLPSFSTDEARARNEAGRMATILRYVNETAAMKKQTLQMTFEFETGTVSWEDPGGKRTEQFASLRGVEMQSRGMVRDGELTVFFGPMGLDEYLWVYIMEKDIEKTIAFNPVSGRVKVL